MIGLDITLENLKDCLSNIEPTELKGMRLLKAHSGTSLFPQNVPRTDLKEAVVEVVQYSKRCRTTAYRLQNLTPIPLKTIPILEYGL